MATVNYPPTPLMLGGGFLVRPASPPLTVGSVCADLEPIVPIAFSDGKTVKRLAKVAPFSERYADLPSA